jgi:hypothetical protein
MSRGEILQVSMGKVSCPKYGEDVTFDEQCRECLFLKRSHVSGNGKADGADGTVICDFVKTGE